MTQPMRYDPAADLLPPTPLPRTQRSAGRYELDVEVGPAGLQLVALANGIVIARSGWSVDVDMAWQSLGIALVPSLLRVANRASNPARDQ